METPQSRWSKRNPDYYKEYYKKNGEKVRAYVKAWRLANLTRSRAYDTNRHRRLRLEVLTAYGTYCVCCGESREPFLTLDHFTEDQGKRASWKGQFFYRTRGHSEYARLKRLGFPPVVRVLCMNCNFARRNKGVCPHENEKTAQLKHGLS